MIDKGSTPTEAQREKNIRVEQEIMGNSLKAETDAEIFSAMWTWTNPDGKQPRTEQAAMSWWRTRYDEPWQTDLEAHVAAWRKKPRDFCNDLNLCVDVLQPRLMELSLWSDYGMNCLCQMPPLWLAMDMLTVTAEQRVDAALRALDSQIAVSGRKDGRG